MIGDLGRARFTAGEVPAGEKFSPNAQPAKAGKQKKRSVENV
jgi:hypothetical protein